MIRKFRKSDTDEVMSIWLTANLEAHYFVPKNYWKSNFQPVKRQISEAEVYVYTENDIIQGFIGISDGHIEGIFVKKESRCRGIGKQLLSYAKGIYGNLSLNVYRKNGQAVDFYLREGFRISSESIDDSTKEEEYTMVWESKVQDVLRLRDIPEIKNIAAQWFSKKWNIPLSEYVKSIEECIEHRHGVPQWYVILDGSKSIIAGAGVIENDFHNRKDLSPNLCALFVEDAYRGRGIAKNILEFIKNDMRKMGYDKLYLVTDYIDFYERYGWKFLTMVDDVEGIPERMYMTYTDEIR